jgi:hypothetical protein
VRRSSTNRGYQRTWVGWGSVSPSAHPRQVIHFVRHGLVEERPIPQPDSGLGAVGISAGLTMGQDPDLPLLRIRVQFWAAVADTAGQDSAVRAAALVADPAEGCRPTTQLVLGFGGGLAASPGAADLQTRSWLSARPAPRSVRWRRRGRSVRRASARGPLAPGRGRRSSPPAGAPRGCRCTGHARCPAG